ncbi:hypothetical protein Cgig2_007057 [Carnegiea gigantea]|uniref:Uncharacterized protein n=1 Tax=Carnegiea gigantea TaxID=171969 RepID=A0A9Q1KAU3_9CARY|nr:hypothetical protein Cgig2_007057 [Carnegiea gigantea]
MEQNSSQSDNCSEIADEFEKNLTLAEDVEEEEAEYDEDDDDDGDFEFSFAGSELTSPISAEEVFQNGQIRPLIPFSDDLVENSDEATTSYGPPVRKLFVVSSAEDNEGVAEGPYCSWSAKSPENSPAPVPEMSRKSNSTGFSKLWKVKDLLIRSHSDGKDAFVFLAGKSEEKVDETASSGVTPTEDDSTKKKKKVNLAKIQVRSRGETASSGKKKTTKSAYEALYGKREKKAGKSYLPYRQDLVDRKR